MASAGAKQDSDSDSDYSSDSAPEDQPKDQDISDAWESTVQTKTLNV